MTRTEITSRSRRYYMGIEIRWFIKCFWETRRMPNPPLNPQGSRVLRNDQNPPKRTRGIQVS